jgi:hypothetical protein
MQNLIIIFPPDRADHERFVGKLLFECANTAIESFLFMLDCSAFTTLLMPMPMPTSIQMNQMYHLQLHLKQLK